MNIDLIFDLDDDLAEAVASDATLYGRTFEEEIRKRLIEGTGEVWEPLTVEDIISDDRPQVALDLRKQR